MPHINMKDKCIAKNICGAQAQKGNVPAEVKDRHIAKNICGARVRKGNAPTEKNKHVAKNICGRRCFVRRCSGQEE